MNGAGGEAEGRGGGLDPDGWGRKEDTGSALLGKEEEERESQHPTRGGDGPGHMARSGTLFSVPREGAAGRCP